MAPPGQTAGARVKIRLQRTRLDLVELVRCTLEDHHSLLARHEVAVALPRESLWVDGTAGVALARTCGAEVVLCDIGLPSGMDGYAVARALRLDPATTSVYLVALTGYAQPEDVRRTREAAFDAHLAKPPDLEALERLVAQAPRHEMAASEGAAPP